jgi:tight adherence protein B
MDSRLILVLAGIALLGVIGGIVFAARGRRGTQVDDRLSRYTGGGYLDTAEPAEARAERGSLLAEALEKSVAERGFAVNIKSQLQQADLKLKVSEYLVTQVLSIFVFGLVSWFILDKGSLGVFTILGAAAGFFAPRVYVRQVANKRRRDFDNQLGDTLNLWVNALRSGYSVLQAMETIAVETAAPVSIEFERVIQEVRLGLTLEQALNNLLKRVPSDDMDLVITAVNVQREVGGNLAEVLAIISHTIRERIRIKGEIATLTAQATISGYIISGLPIALTLFLRASNPEYINHLFVKESPWAFPSVIPCGWLVLALGIILIFSGFMAMRKLAQIDI